MLDVGFSEILLTSAIALIVLGPEKLPKVARQVGNWVGRARAMARQLTEQLEREVSADELMKQTKSSSSGKFDANAATTADVLEVSSQPPIMTHTGAAAVHAHPRLKSDEQLRALAAKGGVIGIFDLPYLSASPHQPNVADYLAHLEHVLKIAGEDHVGIGSDVGIQPFDTSAAGMAEFQKQLDERKQAGLSAPEEDRPTYVEGMNFPRKLELVADQLLKKGYSEQATEKILGGNFARVFGEIWSA